jgi:hypothetical protein
MIRPGLLTIASRIDFENVNQVERCSRALLDWVRSGHVVVPRCTRSVAVRTGLVLQGSFQSVVDDDTLATGAGLLGLTNRTVGQSSPVRPIRNLRP